MASAKVLLIHGLESGVLGKKAVYLRNHFGAENVMVPAMETGTLDFSKNSFLMHGVYNLGSLLTGNFQEQVAFSTVMSGVDIITDLMTKHSFDIVVGSSMGGATIVETLARRGHLFKCPVLLLAPAQRAVRNKFGIPDDTKCDPKFGPMSMSMMYSEINRYRASEGMQRLVIVHGTKDSVVSIEHSKDFVNNVPGSELIEVEDGDHSLNDYLLDGIHCTETGDSKEGVCTPQQNKFAELIRDILNSKK